MTQVVDDLTTLPMVPGDEALTPEDDLALALASQLGVPAATVPLPDEKRVPIGVTWQFDYESGRFVRQDGGATTLDEFDSSLIGSDAPAADVTADADGGGAVVPDSEAAVDGGDAGHRIWQGGAPVMVAGATTLAQWCLMAVHTARFQYAAFSEEFGMEDPGDEIGEFLTGEVLSDFETHLTEALLVHDRITSIDNLTLDWDPVQGVLTIETMDMITDEPDFVVTIQGVQIGGF